MAERRRPEPDTTPESAVAVAEEPTIPSAQALFQRHADEEALDRVDALRLVELRDKANDIGLSAAEQQERMVLEAQRNDRAPRLRRLLYEANTAQAELDIAEVLASWEDLTGLKAAAYEQVRLALNSLYQAWRRVFDIHLLQEQARASLPKDGSSMSTFPSGFELAVNLTSRMPGGSIAWGQVLTSPDQQAWQIDWLSVLDVDPGLKSLETTTLGRIRDRATAYRLRMAQQGEKEGEV